MSTNRRTGGLAAFAGFVAALAAARSPAQPVYTWNKTGGLFSTTANWLPGAAPPAGGDPAATLVFPAIVNGNPVTLMSATNDFGAPGPAPNAFHIYAMTVNVPALTMPASGTNVLQFDGPDPSVQVAGSVTISTPLVLAPTAGALTFNGPGPFTVGLFGDVSGTGGLAFGPSARTVTLNSGNTFTGGMTLSGGTLTLNGNNAAGADGNTLTFNGGALHLNTVTSLNANIVLNATLPVTGSVSGLTLPAATVISGAGGLKLHTTGTLTLQGAATYTGPTIIDTVPFSGPTLGFPGTLVLSGNSGSAVNSSAFDIRVADLVLNNDVGGSAVNNNRVGDAAHINLNHATFTLTGAAAAVPNAETVGPLTGAGLSTVTVNVGSGNANTRLTAASLTRVENGTFVFRGTSLGASPSGPNGNLLYAAPPALVGGGGAAGTPGVSILPYAIYSDVGGASLVTYDVGLDNTAGTADDRGVRPLNAAFEHRMGFSAAAPTDNVRVAGPATVGGPTTVNAIVVSSGGSVRGPGPLTVASGTVLSTNGAGRIDTPLAFGAAEAHLFAASDLAVTNSMTGTGGLTKSGGGTLTLTADNSGLTGPLVINSGFVAFPAPANLPGTGTIRVNADIGIDGLRYTGTGDATLTRDLVVSAGHAQLAVTAGGARLTHAGTIGGVGGFVKTGEGTLILTGTNTFAGAVSVNGPAVISSDANLGVGDGLILNSGALTLAGNWTSARQMAIAGTSAIDTAGFDAAASGPISGTGSLTKSGAGTLTLTGSIANGLDRFTVMGGTLKLGGAGSAHLANTVTAGTSTAIVLEGAALTAGRLSNANVSFNDATLRLVGSPTSATTTCVGDTSRTVDLSGGNTFEVLASGGQTTTLSVTATAVIASVPAMVLVRAPNLGGTGGSTGRVVLTPFPGGQPSGLVGWATAEDLNNPGVIEQAFHVLTAGVRLAQPSDYTAATTIQNPATPTTANVRIATAGQTAGGSNTVNALRLAAGATLTSNATGTLTVTTGAIFVESGAGTATISGPATGNALTANSLYFTTLGDLTVTGAVSGSRGIHKTGPGTLTLAGAVSSAPTAWPLNVAQGTLVLTAPTYAFGTLEGTGLLHLSEPTSLTISGTSSTGRDAIPPTPTTITGPGQLVLGSVVGVGNTPINPVTLSGDNKYTGGTTVNNSTRPVLTHPSAFGTGPVTFGGGNPGVVFDFGPEGTAVVNNDMTLSPSTSASLVLTHQASPRQTISISGILTGGSPTHLLGITEGPMSGTSVIRLTNPANDFRVSQIAVESGILAITSDAALGDPDNSLRFSTFNPPQGYMGTGLRFDADGIRVNRPVSVGVDVSFDTNGFRATLAGQVVQSGVGLTKVGAGVLTLDHPNNSLGGGVTVTEGTLLVNGGVAPGATNPVIVAAGGTLGGTGTIGKPVAVQSGGTLAPGASAGILTITGAVTLDAGSTLALDFDGTSPGTNGYDQLVVGAGGSIDLGGAWLSATAEFDYSGQDVTFITAPTNALTGTFVGLPEGGVFLIPGVGTPSPSYAGTIHYDPAAGTVTIQGIVPVPEPSSFVLAGGVAAVFWLRRRRRSGRGC